MKKLLLPLKDEDILSLKAGDSVLISGTLLTARDAAHKRLHAMIEKGDPLPFDPAVSAIYYAGPCPAAPKAASGSCGPTTSSRVDVFTPELLEKGLKVMIGKGERADFVVQSIREHGAVYFAAIGGCGALYGNCILKSQILAFPDLLSEAIHMLTVKDFPCIVAVDSNGNTIFK